DCNRRSLLFSDNAAARQPRGIAGPDRAESSSRSFHRLLKVWPCPVPAIKGDKMVEILKFIRPGEAAFDPEAIRVLASALDEAWGTILKSGSRFARPAYSRAMKEVVAKRIIEMAQRGVEDQRRSLTTPCGFSRPIMAATTNIQ